MGMTPVVRGRRFARSLPVLILVIAGGVVNGPALGAAPNRPAVQVPICGSFDGEHVCFQGWSTGITITYSGSSTDTQGSTFSDGDVLVGQLLGGSTETVVNLPVNWLGTGTLYLPLPANDSWIVNATLAGAHDAQPSTTVGAVAVGPAEPPPPTTCSTVAQGAVPASAGDPQPWVSAVSATMTGACPGYWIATPTGAVDGVGGAPLLGTVAESGVQPAVSSGGVRPPIDAPVVGIARTPDSGGYWLAASDGGVFAVAQGSISQGNATFYGSMGGAPLNKPVVGIAATPDGQGYWLVASDGGVFAFGDAGYHGSMGGTTLNRPVVGIAATADGQGYWLVASDGGVFAFGDAAFRGSLGGTAMDRSVVGVAADPGGSGYWLVASDGGVFAFGPPFHGSLGGTALSAPVVGIGASTTGAGYYLIGADAAVYAFGDAPYLGAPTRP